MPGPFVRCRFYTESGEPWKGGCRRKDTGCRFIHPDHPDWPKAPASKPRAKGKDPAGFGPGGDRSKASGPAGWDLGAVASTSGGSVPGIGGWDTGAGGWNTGTSTLASPATNQSTNSWDVSTLANEWNRPNTASAESGKVSSSEGGWGNKGAWGASPRNDAWGAGAWGGSGSPPNDAWGAQGGWGAASPSNAWGDNTWGSGDAGDKKDATNARAAPEPMDVDQPEKPPASNKGKGKATLAPPRIRIPGNEDKPERPLKITGTNKDPILGNRWGSGSAVATTSTPPTATPVTTSTPIEPPRLKRKRESDFDDKADTFKEYVKVWERAVRARFMATDAETRRDHFFNLQKSTYYQRVGEGGRKTLDDRRSKLDKEVALQREKLSAAITSLIKFHASISSNLDLGQRYNIGEEATEFISKAKAFVDQIHALPVTQVLEPNNDAPSGDLQTHSLRGDEPSTSKSLLHWIRDLDERLEEAMTELTLRHQRDIRAEIDEALDAALPDMRAKRQAEVERVASQPRPEIVIPPSALKSIEETTQRVQELDAKVPQAVEDIRNLVLRVEDVYQRLNKVEVDLATNRKIYTEMQERVASIQATEQRAEERLKKIETKFEELTASQPLDPAAPFLSQERLMEDLRPAFDAALEKFYQHEVQPAIQALGEAVSEASDQHQQAAIAILWGKVQPVMNAVAGVSQWLDSQELGVTAPVENAQHASSISFQG